MKTPRPYQEAGTVSTLKHLFEKKTHPLVVAPVAAGKSLMIAEIIKKLHEYYPRLRILVLAHVKELIEQNMEELYEQYPLADVGVFCAGLNRKDKSNDITYATIQSMANSLIKLSKPPEVILVDECHLISHNGDTQYRQLIEEALHLNPNCRIVGYTGTPFRADTGRLDKGHNKLFDEVCYEISMRFMIEEGYWAKPTCPDTRTKMDTSDVAVRGGDYVAKQLQEAINKQDVTMSCIDEIMELARNRRKWLVFTAGVQHAEDVCNALRESGVTAEYLTGDHGQRDRAIIIDKFRRGEIRCLVNVAVLTTGFNVPDIDMIAFMRPTRSPVLYIQMIGRGVRPVYEEGYDLSTKQGRLDAIANSVKPDCMVLDFGNVVNELGAIDAISIETVYNPQEEKEGDGERIFKICPSCAYECAPAQRICHNCGYQFLNIEEKAAKEVAVTTLDEKPEWVDVLQVFYNKNFKQDAPSSLKVGYTTSKGFVYEWICFEHHIFGPDDKRIFAWNKACEWHWLRKPQDKPPTTIDDAIDMNYEKPTRIKIKKDGKYWRVLDYDFTKEIEEDLIDEEELFDIPF